MSDDGLCGVPPLFLEASLTCKLPIGHGGDHDWANKGLILFGGITAGEVRKRAAAGSVAAQAIEQAGKSRIP